MKALTYDSYGNPDDVLGLGEAPEPEAGPGQVRIKVSAAGVNPMDWKMISGAMAGDQPLAGTAIPGADAAGVVDQVGADVEGVSIGDDVFGLGSATQAEYAVLGTWVAKPAATDWAVAGSAGVSFETAERGLRLLGLTRGDTLFVDGGAGGVGSVLIQMARAAGLTVIASAGQDNQDYLREIGARPVLYGQGMVNRVLAVPDTHIDAVFDVAGKTPGVDLFALAPAPGKVLSIANFGLAEHGGIVTGSDPEERRPRKAMDLAATLLRDNHVVVQTQTFPLDRAQEAYRISQGGHVRGKLVLLP